MEFKGLKGKWIVDEKSKMIRCGSESVASVWSMNTDELDERLEGESWIDMINRTEAQRKVLLEDTPSANALLISKAPEMLEMLVKITNSNPIHEGYHELKLQAIQLIKEATEL